MGRRMIEAGARFITVLWDAPDGLSWDSHFTSEDLKSYLLPGSDQALSALLDDMKDRGLLDDANTASAPASLKKVVCGLVFIGGEVIGFR